MENPDPRLHFVTATAIVARNRQVSGGERSRTTVPEFLIAKRAATEKAFPNKWTVPGGKLVRSEYENLPKKPYRPDMPAADAPQWYGMMEWVVRKETMEEVNVDVKDVSYLTDLVFIRPDGYPVVTMSFWCWYVSGDAKPGKDLTEVAWVTAAETKTYDMIDGIPEEIEDVERIIKQENMEQENIKH